MTFSARLLPQVSSPERLTCLSMSPSCCFVRSLSPRAANSALLASDHRGLVDDVGLALDPGHYIVRVAPTGQEAISMAADWRPHLILLDMDTEGNEMLQRFAAATRKRDASPSSP